MPIIKFIRRLWHRAIEVSAIDITLGGLAWAAKIYVVWFTIWSKTTKYSSLTVPDKVAFWFFVLALAYAGSQPYFPRRGKFKQIKKDQERSTSMALAFAEITAAVLNRSFRPDTKRDLQRELLRNIMSETKTICGDKRAIRITVTLILPVEHRPDRVVEELQVEIIRNRKTYPIADLAVCEAFKSKKIHFTESGMQCGIPLLSETIRSNPELAPGADDSTTVIGVIAIESDHSDAFDYFRDEIETKNFAYISLMKLILVADEALKVARAEAFAGKQELHAAMAQTALVEEKLSKVQAELDDLKVAFPKLSRRR